MSDNTQASAEADVRRRNPEITKFLSKIGTKGGKAGTGEAKRHGRTSEDYRQMVMKRWRKKNEATQSRKSSGQSETTF